MAGVARKEGGVLRLRHLAVEPQFPARQRRVRVTDVMNRTSAIDTLTSYFAQRNDVLAAYLFGSVARGEDHAASDVDVGVLLRAGKPAAIVDFDVVFAMQDELEERLGCHVDVVVMNGAPLDLLHRILRDGARLLDREPLLRMEFELQARTQYYDFLPLLLRYRETVLRRA